MFNDAHLHIALNHLPVVGYLVALAIAVSGLFIQDRMLNLIAWMITIVSSIFVVVAYLTGEPAEHAIEDLEGISYAYLSAHERWGEWTFYAAMGVGILSLAGWFMNRTKVGGCRKCMVMLTVLLLAANALGTITATLGGGIRHTEIHGDQFGEIIKNVAMQPEIEGEMFEDIAVEVDSEDDDEDGGGKGRGRGRGGDG
jgi:uncharacterized membrane protein